MAAAVQATGAQALTLRVYRGNAVAHALYASLGFQPVPSQSTDEVLFMEALMPATPKAVAVAWVEAFNRGDAAALAAMYHEDAVNHQVAESPVEGREAIQAMFQREFAAAEMVCLVEHLFEDGEWAILEWRDPMGLRGCGFFHVVESRIAFQRGYWDKLSFLRQQGLPIPRD
jgi:limonene-1,2-epoxide hydrolase